MSVTPPCECWTENKTKGHDTDSIFVDFNNAFDKVPHDRLLRKLSNLGVGVVMLNWLLINRKFCVRVGKSLSAWYSAPNGVPKAGFLVHYSFLVYVNVLPSQLCSLSLMYADDIKIWHTINAPNDRKSLQADLNNLAQWVDTWALPVNTAKFAHLHLGRA
ncbi:unnamed protein product [Echinostoma caproni]|uniref:Reverse transcriptase domain-containing protein n=1 Tax=Echinostoma caproni TaxID=27848 RepID=A0A183ANS1_9TREM|nr:unnamed protein product [Echinostoma caproni]